MNYAAESGAAAAAAMIANAIKASGSIVRVEPHDFLEILRKIENPLVVQSPRGIFVKYKYLTSYKGLAFVTKTADPLLIDVPAEMITARKIWIPEM